MRLIFRNLAQILCNGSLVLSKQLFVPFRSRLSSGINTQLGRAVKGGADARWPLDVKVACGAAGEEYDRGGDRPHAPRVQADRGGGLTARSRFVAVGAQQVEQEALGLGRAARGESREPVLDPAR